MQKKYEIQILPNMSSNKHITAQYDSLYHGLATLNEAGHGRLTIGVTQSLGAQILPQLLPQYHAAYPNVELHLVEYPSSEVENELANDNLDLYIGVLPVDNHKIHYQLFEREPIYLLVPPSYPAYHKPTKAVTVINDCHDLIDRQPFNFRKRKFRLSTFDCRIFSQK